MCSKSRPNQWEEKEQITNEKKIKNKIIKEIVLNSLNSTTCVAYYYIHDSIVFIRSKGCPYNNIQNEDPKQNPRRMIQWKRVTLHAYLYDWIYGGERWGEVIWIGRKGLCHDVFGMAPKCGVIWVVHVSLLLWPYIRLQ